MDVAFVLLVAVGLTDYRYPAVALLFGAIGWLISDGVYGSVHVWVCV
jgi:hypothetical protein